MADRFIVFNGENLYEEDVLKTNLFSMIGLAKLTDCALGNSVSLNRFACTPTSPASLNVLVAPGEIYSLQNIDNTTYGSLPADTTHQIVKQGILMDAVQLSCPAPGTVGFSIAYLIQIAYADSDILNENRTFYQAAPQVVPTVRSGVCLISAKPGTAAATGTQTPPTPDAGYTGAYVVTVANGQTTITSGNIAVASGAPFVTEKLKDKISQAFADARYALKGAVAGSINRRVITTTSTYTPTTGLLYADIEVVGAGAGGGGSGSGGGSAAGGGGGAGGYARGIFSAATIGASQAITINAPGAGASGTSTGGTGGTVSCGSLLSATGGLGGGGCPSISQGTVGGGLGGTGTGGDFQGAGGCGGNGIVTSPIDNISGAGGDTLYGGGGSVQSNNNGGNGQGYGGGGSGAASKGGVNNTGGTGAPGVVIITEYIAA